MGKRSTKARRSLGSVPKGLIRRGKHGREDTANSNPFEVAGTRQKRPKWEVHNRPVSKPKSTKMALENLQRRHKDIRNNLKSSKKANKILDRRIGQYDPTMSREDQMLARLVKERTRQSHRSRKYQLDDNEDEMNDGFHQLTHKGQKLDPLQSEQIYSDDDDKDKGYLEEVDTEMHFGGKGMGASRSIYGSGGTDKDLSKFYENRGTELDDLIHRRKLRKAEKMQAKESQVDTVEKLDQTFGQLSELLSFRKDQKQPLRPGKPTQEEKEMNEWNMEMRSMMTKPKLKATDRIKTPEEIAKEEAEKLHELETRRLARMNGDFEEDDFSDISDGETKRKRPGTRNPDEISDDDSDDENKKKITPQMTAEGLKYFDNDGNVVESEKSGSNDENDKTDSIEHDSLFSVGDRVLGNYRAAEQFSGRDTWYEGTISKVTEEPSGSVSYHVDYDDGDFEENMVPKNVRRLEKSAQESDEIGKAKEKDLEVQMKRNKARQKARREIPFIFEAPTTLEALHDLIAKYATTGEDASLIIQRIHRANSVRLDHRNTEKMQNFYDVLLRRFVAVGDAIFASGDGGKVLGRYQQLNVLTQVMYAMAQDSPKCAAAVWNRRMGILQSAHSKRLRDSEFVDEEEEEDFMTAWPSTGVFFLLRAMGHIFPVTDRRHCVVTPALILLGQIVALTPISSVYDVAMGLVCSGLLLEYSKDAQRVVPEAVAFVAGVIRLYSSKPGQFPSLSMEAAYQLPAIRLLREKVSVGPSSLPAQKISLQSDFLLSTTSETAVAVLSSALTFADSITSTFNGSPSFAPELLHDLAESILSLKLKSVPETLQEQVSLLAPLLAIACATPRPPLQRRASASKAQMIKSLIPRMQDPERYSMSKDKGKKSVQAAIDRTRREYKREHKAVSRELRMDASFLEEERRRERGVKDAKARFKRQKNFAWLEQEQGTMNQQVAQGGGLLKGGGMGAAKAKAKSGKLGIKKGGKF